MSRLLNGAEVKRFKKILFEYQPNSKVLNQFKSSNFAVIAGPAGAGKDTLRNSLVKNYPELYVPILSTTTRPPRKGEVDGLTYHFRSIEQVKEGLARREFFQTALVHNQQISCLHIHEINKLNSRQYGLSILVVQTEAELRVYHPRQKTIFITPPSKSVLLERINSERLLDEAEIERRLHAAKAELSYALDASQYYCLVSDTVPHITKYAHAYLQNETRHPEEDARARATICKILKSLDN